MAYEHLCMYCFKDLNGASVCPHCGKDSRAAVPQIQMLPGTLVYRERFLVGRALGQDAGGIVYNALDTRKGGVIRIREYLPRNCAERLGEGGVVPLAGMEDSFEAGMRKLRASVESVEDPRKRHFYFEENGTAYIAQRKNVKGTPMPEEDDFDDDDDRSRSHIGLYIAIAIAVVAVIAVGIIWFISSMSEPDDITINQPLPTVSAEATWKPAETPTPTPYATATFAALVDPELSWMDYIYDGDVEKEYADKQSSVQNTKKPTIITDKEYDTVGASSSKANVEELQERLAKLGWLEYYDVTGKYDSATKQAVKDFQNYVNEHCSPAKKLAVDGIAGEKTQQWLYNSSVSLTKPTPTPKPIVTPKPDSSVINADSPAREIRNLQRQLIILDLLPEGSADGKFGSATTKAVQKFQMRVNQIQGYDALEITGKVDELTQAFLEFYVEDWLNRQEEEPTPTPKPTATPKPTETPEPDDGVIDADSDKEKIAFLQEQLVTLGLLDSWDVDGVYGRGTVSAVKQFQRWVNEQRGTETLEVTGECDLLTQRYLEYCIENNMSPMQPTPSPEPTPEPTDEPEENGNVVDPSSPKESISFVQEMLATVGLLKNSDVDGDYGSRTTKAVKEFQRFVNNYYGEEKLEVTGICDASTLQFLEYAYGNDWNIGDENATPEPTQAPTPEPTDAPDDTLDDVINADSDPREIAVVQEMLAGIRLLDEGDIDGDYGKKTRNAILALQQFVNEQRGTEVLELTGECDPLTMQYLEYCYEQGWDVGSAVNPSEPDPTEPPYDEPAYPDEPEQPSTSEIKGFTVEVDGREANGQLIELESGKHSIRWSARDGVESFHVYLYDGSGNLINSKTVSGDGELTVKASDLEPGEIYRMEIGALPENGSESDIVWQTVQLSRYVPEEVEDEPTREPEKKPAKIGKPSISIGSPAHQEDGVPYISGDTVIFSWMADGDVEYYNATLIYEDGTSYSLGDTTDTSKTVSAEQLEPGLWKLRIGAMPVNGSEDDMKWNEMIFGVPAPEADEPDEPEYEPDAPTDAPEAGDGEIIEYIDAESAPEQIQLVQMALYKHGLIDPDDIAVGQLDELTIEAVIQFQMLVREFYGIELEIIDPESDDPIFIDQFTLDCLLYREMDLNP